VGKNVIYMRQSLGLDKQKHSLDMQRTTCLEFATEVSTVIDEIYNEGICSAAKTSIEERPVLNKLLKDAEKGMIDKLFIFKRDRLARNIQQYLSIIKQLQKSKVEVFFTADQEPGIFKGPTGEFIEAILAGLAEQEARNIKKRLILSRKQLAR
jgi:site-specific DNA recombinase